MIIAYTFIREFHGSSNYLELVKNDMKKAYENEYRKYSIKYKFVKMMRQIPNHSCNIHEFFKYWIKSNEVWSNRVPPFTPNIHHRKLGDYRSGKMKCDELIISNRYELINDENRLRLKNEIEGKYNIKIPKNDTLIDDVLEWIINEDDYFDFIDFNQLHEIKLFNGFNGVICMERTTNPMVDLRERIDRIHDLKYFEELLRVFPCDPTEERYNDIVKSGIIDHEMMADAIYQSLNGFKLGEIRKLWMGLHNYHAEQAGISRRVKIEID